MKDFYFYNKNYKQQIKAGRNNTVKHSAKAGEPIPLTSSYTLGDKLTLSSDGKYIVVGDDVSVVELYAQVHFTSSNATSCGLAIRKIRASNSSDDMIAIAYGTGTSFTVSTRTYSNVSKGDKIYIASASDATINPSSGGGTRTALFVKKIA